MQTQSETKRWGDRIFAVRGSREIFRNSIIKKSNSLFNTQPENQIFIFLSVQAPITLSSSETNHKSQVALHQSFNMLLFDLAFMLLPEYAGQINGCRIISALCLVLQDCILHLSFSGLKQAQWLVESDKKQFKRILYIFFCLRGITWHTRYKTSAQELVFNSVLHHFFLYLTCDFYTEVFFHFLNLF